MNRGTKKTPSKNQPNRKLLRTTRILSMSLTSLAKKRTPENTQLLIRKNRMIIVLTTWTNTAAWTQTIFPIKLTRICQQIFITDLLKRMAHELSRNKGCRSATSLPNTASNLSDQITRSSKKQTKITRQIWSQKNCQKILKLFTRNFSRTKIQIIDSKTVMLKTMIIFLSNNQIKIILNITINNSYYKILFKISWFLLFSSLRLLKLSIYWAFLACFLSNGFLVSKSNWPNPALDSLTLLMLLLIVLESFFGLPLISIPFFLSLLFCSLSSYFTLLIFHSLSASLNGSSVPSSSQIMSLFLLSFPMESFPYLGTQESVASS